MSEMQVPVLQEGDLPCHSDQCVFVLASLHPWSWPPGAHQDFSFQVPSTAGGTGHWGVMVVHET